MSGPPALGGIAPGLRCTRLLDWPDESSRCPNDATWHVLWTEDMEDGLSCDEHAAAALRCCIDMHRYDPICSIPGALWAVEAEPTFCFIDDLLVSENAETATLEMAEPA